MIDLSKHIPDAHGRRIWGKLDPKGEVAPYPTRGEISKRLAGQWYAPALFSPMTRRLVAVLKRLA